MADDDQGDDKKPKPIPLIKLARKANVPMGQSPKISLNVPTYRGTPVGWSEDFQRVLDLPRREPLDLESPRAQAMVDLITARYTNGVPSGQCNCRTIDPNRFLNGANGCITELLPVQAWTLYEMGLVGGCVGSVQVGFGKTNLGILGVYPLGVKNALLLIPSNLADQFYLDYRLLREHFRVPSLIMKTKGKRDIVPGEPELHVLPYGHLCRPKYSGWIDELKPEALLVDECDKLADLRGSATAKRVLRYYVESVAAGRRPKFAGWTGSLSDKRIQDYLHLMIMALGENAPVPLDPGVGEQWGNAINVMEQRADPGVLRAFCEGDEDVRKGYGRRVAETLGVITTSESNVERMGQGGIIKGSCVEVVIQSRSAPEVPEIVQAAMESVRQNVRPDSWFGAPDDEELDSPMEVQRSVMEIACGVMNVWEFWPTTPDRKKFLVQVCSEHEAYAASCQACLRRSIEKGAVPQERQVVEDWYAARKPWNKEVRAQCILGIPHLDSPHLCELAAMRAYGELPIPPCPAGTDQARWEREHPVWPCPEWPAWRDLKHKVKPMPVSKRVHPYLAEDAARWALENKGIVWYSLVEFGQMVTEISELPLFGGGKKAERALKKERGDRSIVASIDSHGRGRNGLQFLFEEQLLCQVPSSSRRWSQLLGRLVRRGQRGEQVMTWIYTHVPELRKAVESAVKRSEYVEDTLRMKMKLLSGWKG